MSLMASRARGLAIVLALAPSASQAAAWPPDAAAGGSYIVQPADAVRDISDLTLPDRFTLKFAPTVRALRWNVASFKFGIGATIDLSAPDEASPGQKGTTPAPQTVAGAAGAQGGTGAQGGWGREGRVLVLKIASLAPTGSLWIKGDGARGGVGGAGGKGQTGGPSTCDPTMKHGGPGGPGGPGGWGGQGGGTSLVIIEVGSYPAGSERFPLSTSPCGGSSRPSDANGNDGKIAISSSPGCGGEPGRGGDGGDGGDEFTPHKLCHRFGIPPQNVFVWGGVHGLTGVPGPSPAAPGFPRMVMILGPQPASAPLPPGALARDRCIAGDAAACALYAGELRPGCDAVVAPVEKAICLLKVRAWGERGLMLQRAKASCPGATEAQVMACAEATMALHVGASPSQCDNPPNSMF